MKNIISLPFKRRAKGKTDYRKRITLLSSNQLRLVVRKSLKNISISLVEYDEIGDKTIINVNSKSLEKFGWNAYKCNVPSAYLAGLLLGKMAKEKGIKKAILDIGLSKSVKGSAIYAVVAGALDAGVEIPHTQDILPPKDRIIGTHISKYAEMLKKDTQRYERQFGNYLKSNVDPLQISTHFEEIKNKIMQKNGK